MLDIEARLALFRFEYSLVLTMLIIWRYLLSAQNQVITDVSSKPQGMSTITTYRW
jgi:hypothetical protein